MKRIFSILPLVMAWSLIMVMHGCTADVDLNNIDTSVEVDANVATPIGSVTATISDFVGDGTWGIFVDSVDHKGALVFRDTFSISRKFHNLDLSQYIGKTTITMNIYEKLGGTIVGTDKTVPITFPLTLKLSGINNDENYQRLDSALIKNASFVSNITKAGGLPLEWEWIEKVTLDLGSAFHRKGGNVVTIYNKGDKGGYGENMPINVDEFSMNLMKNKNPQKWEDYRGNVVDSCTFDITMYVNIPSSAGIITVPETAAFNYNLNVTFIDYHAIWGMFEPSSEMSDEDEVVIADAWSGWKTLQGLCLPFADPSVDVKVTTQIAGALVMNGEYLYVANEAGNEVYATFDGNQSLYKYFNKNEYLGLNSEIGDSATMHILFDKDPARGHIDRLFSIRPDKLGYKFSINFNRQETPQIRITDNTSICVDAECEVPFVFNEGVSLGYSDTIKGIDLSMLSLDSLLQDVTVIDTVEEASAKVAIIITNSIPLDFKARFVCLDSLGHEVIDPETNEPLMITETDTIVIEAPTQEYINYQWISTPKESIHIVNVDKDDLETLRSIKSIAFSAAMDDESMKAAYKQGQFNVSLKENDGLKIKIAVGANVEAILNLDSLMQ